MSENETYSTEGPKCPFCGNEFTPDEAHYFDEMRYTSETCDSCGKDFDVDVYTQTSWTCTKPSPQQHRDEPPLSRSNELERVMMDGASVCNTPERKAYDMKLKTGDRIKFAAEKQPYRVRVADARFAVCTKPFNLRKTVLYTIVDLEQGVRGADDRIFSEGYETDEEIAQALKRLQAGEIEVSRRNRVDLDIERVY